MERKFKLFWNWASNASLAQWILTPIWGQIMAFASAAFVLVTDTLRELPLSITIPGALATYVLVLSSINLSWDLWKKWWWKQAATTKLWSLRSSGITLRNRPLSTLDEYDQWKQEIDVWLSQVYEQAERVSPNLRQYVERLDRMSPPPANINFIHSEHHRWVSITSEVLARLQEHLQRELSRN